MNNVDFKWKTIHQFMQDIELKTTRTTDNVGSPPPTAPPEQTLPVGQSINQFWWCGTNSLRISFGTLGALTWINKISGISESSCRTWIARWWNSCNNDQLHMELSYYSFQNMDMHIRFTIFTSISTSQGNNELEMKSCLDNNFHSDKECIVGHWTNHDSSRKFLQHKDRYNLNNLKNFGLNIK